MKMHLIFDMDDEKDKKHYQYALIAPQMAGMIDSYLDYLSIVVDTCVNGKFSKKHFPTPQDLFNDIYGMYASKIVQFGVKEALDEDLHYLVEGLALDDETGEVFSLDE